MNNYWIVSINIPYYPWVEVFDNETKAKTRYEEAIKNYPPSEEYGGSVYLAKVVSHMTREGIEKEVEEE